jgi:hypothetical protein
MSAPKEFFWKITAEPKQARLSLCQEQCSSGGGGNGKCGTGK